MLRSRRRALAVLTALAFVAVPLAGCLEAGDNRDDQRPPVVVDNRPGRNATSGVPENATWVRIGESANWTVRATTFPEPVPRGTIVPFWVELTPKPGARMPSATYLNPGVWVKLENGTQPIDVPREGRIVSATFIAGTTPGPGLVLNEAELADAPLSASTEVHGPTVPLAEEAETRPLARSAADRSEPSGLTATREGDALTATFAFTGPQYACPPPEAPEGNATLIQEEGRQVLVMLISYAIGDVCGPEELHQPERVTLTLANASMVDEVRAHLAIRSCFCPPPHTGQGWTTVAAPVSQQAA